MAGRADIQAGRAFVSIYAKTSEFAHALVNAETRLKTFADSTGQIGALLENLLPSTMYMNFGRLVESVGQRVASLGKATIAFGSGLAISSAAMSLAFLKPIQDASDLEETLSKFRIVFGPQTDAVLQWGNAYAAAVGRSRQETAAFLAGAQDLFVPLGFTADAAEGMSKQITQLAFDLASFNNMQDADAMRDLQAALTGSGETMKKYGVVLTENAVKQQLWSQSIDPATATEQQKVMARWTIIMAGTTAAQGDAIRTSGGWANQTKALLGTIKDLSASIGQALLPVVTPVLQRVNEIAKAFANWTRANQETIRTIARLTLGRAALGAGIAALGVGLLGLSPGIGLFGKLIGAVGSVSRIVMPAVLAFRLMTMLFGSGAVISFVTSVGSMVASLVSFSGIMAGIGSAISFAAPILAAMVVVTAAIATAFVAAAAGVAAATAAFVYLAKPVSSLTPLFRSITDSIMTVLAAIGSGDWQGAVTAAIEGVRRGIGLGVIAIMKMATNAMRRLPGMISGSTSGVDGIFSRIASNVRRAFSEIWPVVRQGFSAFVLFAGDVMDRLPEMAGYAAGRITRALAFSFIKFNQWLWKTFSEIASSIVSAFVGFGPKLLKAIFTGDTRGMFADVAKALAVSAGLGTGLAGGEIAAFEPSAETRAAWDQLAESVAGVKREIAMPATGATAGPAATGGTATAGAKPGKDVVSAFDRTPVEKYRRELAKLKSDFDAGRIGAEQLADGMEQLRKDSLSIEGTKVEQFSQRLELLGQALTDGTISLDEWRRETQAAQQEILGIEPRPIDAFRERLKLLYDAMQRGGLTSSQFVDELREAKTEILGIDPAPVEQLRQRVRLLDEAEQAGVISQQQYADAVRKAKEELLGLQPTALQQFQSRVQLLSEAVREGKITQAEWSAEVRRAKEETLGLAATPLDAYTKRVQSLREQLAAGAITNADFGREFRAAQQEFLGLDPKPLDTYRARIEELRKSLNAGLITPDMFNAAAAEALPDQVKQIVNDTRTPLEKYRKEMSDLKKLRDTGLINDELFNRKAMQISQQLPQTNVLATYSASALATSGRGGVTVQDKMLDELREQRKAVREQTEEARAARKATEKLADGMTAR